MSAVGFYKKENVNKIHQLTEDNLQSVHLETDKKFSISMSRFLDISCR